MTTQSFRIGESLSTGWQLFSKHAGLLIASSLCYLAPVLSLSFLASLAKDAGRMDIYAATHTLSLLVSAYLVLGLVVIALKIFDNREVSLSDLFTNYDLFLPFVGAQVLYFLAVFIGCILLVIPGFFALVSFMFYDFSIVDKRLSPVDALKGSATLTKGHRWRLFGFFLAVGFVNLLGLLALGVGIFVTIPMTLIAKAYVYRKLCS